MNLNARRALFATLAAIFLFLPWTVESESLSPEGRRMLGIALAAVILWVSEAVPLHATAAIIILLEIAFISDQGLISPRADFDAPSHAVFFACLASPTLMLFLGGFFLADCSAKFQLDRNLARTLLRPFGTSPAMITLGLMLITALLSMFMSNTATAATMMAVVLPVIAQLAPENRLRTGIALAIAVAANVGGIGTPIGTPPNAIAIGALIGAGHPIGFLQWMLMMVPFMLLTLLAGWALIVWLHGSSERRIELKIDARFNTSPPAVVFYATFAVTVVLWLTESLHGLNSSIVGFVPVVVLLSTRIFTIKDFQSLQWHILWLLAGGIALGQGMEATGLDRWIVGLFAWDALTPAALVGALSLLALAMSTLMSNTASANLLIPIGMSLGTSSAVAVNPLAACTFIAIGCSLAMALPISTPPNAIVMSAGTVTTRQMVVVGGALGLIGWALFVFVAPLVWNLLGLMPS